jgi:hypothetical protein
MGEYMNHWQVDRKTDVAIAKLMGLNVVALDWPCGYDPECGCYQACHFNPPIGCWYNEHGPVFVPANGTWPPEPVETDLFDETEHFANVEPVPFYSDDIVAAWEVADAFSILVSPCLTGGWGAGQFNGTTEHPDGGQRFCVAGTWAEAPEAPLAICRAVLKVREVWR